MRNRLLPLVVLGLAVLVVGEGVRDVALANDGVQSRQQVPTRAQPLTPLEESMTPESGTLLPTRAPAFNLDWWSVNGGGATNVAGANFGLGITVGQAAAGHVSGSNYRLGVGFWYGVASGGGCPMTIFGDVDLSTTVTSADIIYLVNFVFKGGPNPQPCDAAGDVDCSGSVTSADIIYLVNFVFKGGPPPCNTCTSPLAGAC